MKLNVPKSITSLISNVSETAYSEWDDSTSYVADNYVYVTQNEAAAEVTPHKIYKSLSSNLDKYPPDNTSDWADQGATNRWKMCDSYINTQTTNTTSIVVTVDASKCDTVALFNFTAIEISLDVENASVSVYQEDFDMLANQSYSWSDYFFNDVLYKTNFIQTIPSYATNTTVEVTITYVTGSTAECGMLIVGKSQYIGESLYGIHAGIIDYSKKDTNAFGNTYLNQGNFANKIDADVLVEIGAVDQVKRLLTDNRATPCVWQVNNSTTEYESLNVYGFYKEFSLVLPGPKYAQCNIEIEGLI